ncbi:MAG: hypothetical protein AB8G77_09260 [Rhodothermales bacterium]
MRRKLIVLTDLLEAQHSPDISDHAVFSEDADGSQIKFGITFIKVESE